MRRLPWFFYIYAFYCHAAMRDRRAGGGEFRRPRTNDMRLTRSCVFLDLLSVMMCRLSIAIKHIVALFGMGRTAEGQGGNPPSLRFRRRQGFAGLVGATRAGRQEWGQELQPQRTQRLNLGLAMREINHEGTKARRGKRGV